MVVSAGRSLHKFDNSSSEMATKIGLQQIDSINNEVRRLYDLLEVKYKSRYLYM